MDFFMFLILCFFWTSTSLALVGFFIMWYYNRGEAFHPHSVDILDAHKAFSFVSSPTICKFDFGVKSISAYASVRGSTSSKQFSTLTCMTAMSGLLGVYRWSSIGDAKSLEANLAYIGFAALFLVATFELDVRPERYLEDKLQVTSWLLEKMDASKYLNFKYSMYDKDYVNFIRSSKKIYNLFEEDRTVDITRSKQVIGGTLHMAGAVLYMGCICASVIVNDHRAASVGWVTVICFCIFGTLGWMTGGYFFVLRFLRTWILTWNPFLREAEFLGKLKESVVEHLDRQGAFASEVCKLRQKNNSSSDSKFVAAMALKVAAKNDSSQQQQQLKSRSPSTGRSTASSPTPALSSALTVAASATLSSLSNNNNNIPKVVGCRVVKTKGSHIGELGTVEEIIELEHKVRVKADDESLHWPKQTLDNFTVVDDQSSSTSSTSSSSFYSSSSSSSSTSISNGITAYFNSNSTPSPRSNFNSHVLYCSQCNENYCTGCMKEASSEAHNKYWYEYIYLSIKNGNLVASKLAKINETLTNPACDCKRCQILKEMTINEEQLFKNTWSLRLAHNKPAMYLKIQSYMLCMSELVCLLTPAVAIGMQWATALCGEQHADQLFMQLVSGFIKCWWFGENNDPDSCNLFNKNSDSYHCILKECKTGETFDSYANACKPI